jgi:hypothetical protein
MLFRPLGASLTSADVCSSAPTVFLLQSRHAAAVSPDHRTPSGLLRGKLAQVITSRCFVDYAAPSVFGGIGIIVGLFHRYFIRS